MTFLGDVNDSSSSSSSSSPHPHPHEHPDHQQMTSSETNHNNSLDSDFVVILAALLCALICVLGLVAVARCAWIRRISARTTTSTNTTNPAAPPNKGLEKKVLKSLPRLTYSPEVDLSECAICLAEFAAGDEIRVLPQCGHGFHVRCIDTWLGSHSSCPSCRRILEAAGTRCQNCGDQYPAGAAETEGGGTRETQHPQQMSSSTFLP